MRLDPAFAKLPIYHHELAATLYFLGRREESLRAHRKVTELEPSWADGWGNVGFVAHLLGRHREAVEAFEQALRLDPAYFDTRLDHRERWVKSREQLR